MSFQKTFSASIRLPQNQLSRTNGHCCCVKTCVQLQSTGSALNPNTKQKLLQMINSLEKQYTEEMYQQQYKYQNKISELQHIVNTLRSELSQSRVVQIQKIVVDTTRQNQLLQRISELQKQKTNIVTNKVSYIQTNLTTKIHDLEHQLQCQQLQSNEQINKLKQQLISIQNELNSVIEREAIQKKKLQEYCRQVQNDLTNVNNAKGNQGRNFELIIQDLEKQIIGFKVQLQSKSKIADKNEADWKEKYSDLKKSYDIASSKYQKAFEQKGKIIEQKYAQRLEIEKMYMVKESQLKDSLKQQNRKDLQNKINILNREWEIKLAATQQKAAKTLFTQRQNWLTSQKLVGEQYTKELNNLRSELDKQITAQHNLQEQYKQRQKQKQQEWNRLYQQYEKEYEQRVKDLEARLEDIHYSQQHQYKQKEKQYVYIEKLVHSQQGKLAVQKFLKLSKQMLDIETKLKDLQLQYQKQKNTLNYYKALQSTFDQERQKWKLQKQVIVDRYSNNKNPNDLTWVVERIINAQSNHQSVKIDNNTRVIPSEHLPCISYRVVSNQQQLSNLVLEKTQINHDQKTGLS